MKRGLLLTLTEPPAAMEEEFNAWYDTEHLAERLAIPGFRLLTTQGEAPALCGVLQVRQFLAESGEKIALHELYDVNQPPSIVVFRRYQP
jgi:hypothetical protein